MSTHTVPEKELPSIKSETNEVDCDMNVAGRVPGSSRGKQQSLMRWATTEMVVQKVNILQICCWHERRNIAFEITVAQIQNRQIQ